MKMKVKAIYINGSKNITLNKVYEVINEIAESYLIKNDLDREGKYKKIRFSLVIETSTFKVGDKFEDDTGNKFVLVSHNDMVAMANMDDGNIISGFYPVANVMAITVEEMSAIDDEWFDTPLRKI
jgi:hypothetical protein